MIISRTPFRVSFFGGGTDFPEYYRTYGGATLLTTIDKYAYISVHELSEFFKHRYIGHYARTEHVIEPAEFQHPLIRECLLHLNVREGVEISHVADLPGRTGLGTSSSFTVGLLNALHWFRGERVSEVQLAEEAIVVERERVGDPGGHQDQYATALGGLMRLDFSGEREIQVTRPGADEARVSLLQEHLMLFYTGIEQSANLILEEQRRNVRRNQDSLKAMARMVDDAVSVLVGTNSILEFGDLLHESWMIKRGLSRGIANQTIDDAYHAARRAGARGGKLLGAGGRGFLLVFAAPEAQAGVRYALRSLKEVQFTFGQDGTRVIFETSE